MRRNLCENQSDEWKCIIAQCRAHHTAHIVQSEPSAADDFAATATVHRDDVSAAATVAHQRAEPANAKCYDVSAVDDGTGELKDEIT